MFGNVTLYIASYVGEVSVTGIPDGACKSPYVLGIVRELCTESVSAQLAAESISTHHIQQVRVVGCHGCCGTTYVYKRKEDTELSLEIVFQQDVLSWPLHSNQRAID